MSGAERTPQIVRVGKVLQAEAALVNRAAQELKAASSR